MVVVDNQSGQSLSRVLIFIAGKIETDIDNMIEHINKGYVMTSKALNIRIELKHASKEHPASMMYFEVKNLL